MSSKTEHSAASATPRPPLFSLLLATGLGAGYLPFAPGTWGSLEGLAIVFLFRSWVASHSPAGAASLPFRLFGPSGLAALILLFLLGVYASSRVARHLRLVDPQCVVVDEIFGQCFTLFLAPSLNWRYWALGFILFRAFDIWKPFPVRQAESLPAGWGIMADDALAALYAVAVLWLAKVAGLPA